MKTNSSQEKIKNRKDQLPKNVRSTMRPSTIVTQPTTTELEFSIQETTVVPEPRIYKNINNNKENGRSKVSGEKPVWPDIFKNEYEKLFWNAENIYDDEMSNEDDEDEENYFSEYQWDEEDKSVKNNNNNVNNFNRFNKFSSRKNNVNRKGTHRTNSKPSYVNNAVNVKSINDLSVVNNIVNKNNKYEFVHFLSRAVTSTVRPVANVTNNVQKDDNWPNFSYHRVTVNPNKEKFKNNSKAFIVVSEISPKNNSTISETILSSVDVAAQSEMITARRGLGGSEDSTASQHHEVSY